MHCSFNAVIHICAVHLQEGEYACIKYNVVFRRRVLLNKSVASILHSLRCFYIFLHVHELSHQHLGRPKFHL